ncbi:short-chain dehydrogenase [Novosphingobium malaysiense]|uniref:Peroxisomal trans-2-enoyl-CoA reductase n=2 Tax=Novosphingobium malaysiense TaxID=1348853 RepID=A0A0B1ZFD8_9SPHN|nr:short-chain dehydrogenase [Novosphingobium malaysiense]
MEKRIWGIQPEELATRPTIYRDDLFAGQKVVLSGGGSGMGRATLFLLLRLGADVLICGRDGEKLDRAADDAERLVGRRPLTHSMTIRDSDQVEGLADAAFEQLGGVDHLVNSAGGQFPINVLDLKPKGWNAVVDTNLNGTYWMISAFGRRWVERDEPGNVVTLTMVSDRGVPQSAHSCAARAGVLGLTKSLAVEWAPHHIRLNCLAPGTIETEGLNQYPESLLGRMGQGNPMRKMGDTWDIAEAVVWLMSPAADFVTGEFLHIDGGMQLLGTNWPLGKPEWFEGM